VGCELSTLMCTLAGDAVSAAVSGLDDERQRSL